MKGEPTKTDAADPNIASIAESLRNIAQSLSAIHELLKDAMPDVTGRHPSAIVRVLRTVECSD